VSLSRAFGLLGRQADSARASQRASSSSAGGIAMKTMVFGFLFAVALSACAPAVAPAPTPTSIPATATAIPSTATPTAQPTVKATEIAELRGNFKANGRSLYIYCQGTGSPTIVLEGDAGQTVSVMAKLQTTLAARTTTCAYDRAGLSFSDRAPTPRTAKDVVGDLHALLAASAVPGPYLLVGNGFGGQFVQLYARMFPDQVVGVVAVDPMPPSPPWLDEVSKVYTPQEYASEKSNYGGGNEESIDLVTSGEQLAAAPQPPDVPFEMLLSTDCQGDQTCLKSQPTYERIMKGVAAAWQRGTSSLLAVGNLLEDDPDAIVAAVGRVLASH
jgi:pimeloyl-ACP methyl ester carboxylesterase